MSWPLTTDLSIRHYSGSKKRGVISGNWETSSTNRRARYYRLTPAGRKRLAAEHSKWEQMAAAITRVMRPA